MQTLMQSWHCTPFRRKLEFSERFESTHVLFIRPIVSELVEAPSTSGGFRAIVEEYDDGVNGNSIIYDPMPSALGDPGLADVQFSSFVAAFLQQRQLKTMVRVHLIRYPSSDILTYLHQPSVPSGPMLARHYIG